MIREIALAIERQGSTRTAKAKLFEPTDDVHGHRNLNFQYECPFTRETVRVTIVDQIGPFDDGAKAEP